MVEVSDFSSGIHFCFSAIKNTEKGDKREEKICEVRGPLDSNKCTLFMYSLACQRGDATDGLGAFFGDQRLLWQPGDPLWVDMHCMP